MKRLLLAVFGVLFVVVWPILLMSTAVTWIANQPGFYNAGFERHGVAAATGIRQSELDLVARKFVEYFNSSQEYVDIKIVRQGQEVDLFNKREVEHMKDVKGLVRFGYAVQWVSLLYATIFTSAGLFWWKGKRRRAVYKLVLGGCLATLFVMAGIAAMVLFNFEGFFLGFHLLSFSNDFWQLDPARDYLIRLFPEGFFFDASLLIGVAMMLEAAVVGGVAWWLLKRGKTEGGVLTTDY